MSTFNSITVYSNEHVATITLNRPEAMNAISQLMRKELLNAINTLENDKDIRIVIINSEGRGFSSGTDLSEGLAGYPDIGQQIKEEYKPVLLGIANSNKVYISATHGVCAGIGSALALSCDLAIMADDSCFYLAFAGLSLVPDGGLSQQLVQTMGYKRAFQAFVETSRIDASLCLQYGLVNKLAPADQLHEHAQAWAEQLAQGAPLAQSFGKQAFRKATDLSLEESIDMEADLQVECSNSEDAMTAIGAFFEKKKPTFAGK